MTWSHENKEKIQYIVSFLGFVCGIIMCFADFCIEPLAQIHDTSLWFLGQMIAFICAVFGISLHYTAELNNFKQEILNSKNKNI